MRGHDAGVILINVLVALAIGSAVVVLMLTSQEILLDRSRRAAAATQAEALVRGAEASVIAALRRDMTDAPGSDHYGEAWAKAAQSEVSLPSGRFSVTITDAQGRFDLNGLGNGGVLRQQAFLRLLGALDLPATVAGDIIAQIGRDGPLPDLSALTAVDAQTRARLAPHVSLLPVAGTLNLNTAGPLALTAVLGSPSRARQLLQRRAIGGSLTARDLRDLGILVAPGTGFTSDVWDISVLAEVDGTEIQQQSRLLRVRGIGTVAVRVISRSFAPD